MSEPLLSLTNVALRNERGGYVFRDLNLTLEPGDSAIITGSSGSGKTMLIELVVGLRIAASGSVEVFGQNLSRRSRAIRKIRQRVGGVGGPFGLVPSLTVADNITLPLVLGGVKKRTRSEKLFKVLTEFSLLKTASLYPSSLTRVETTLAMLARASIANQPLLIIDEPLSGLDRSTWERVVDSLKHIAISGRSMLVVSTELTEHDIPSSSHLRIESGVLV